MTRLTAAPQISHDVVSKRTQATRSITYSFVQKNITDCAKSSRFSRNQVVNKTVLGFTAK